MTINEQNRYHSYSIRNFRNIPQMEKLSEEEKFAIEVVGMVLPFKVNNYVVDELIDWDNYENDPIFTLVFPKQEMLLPKHYDELANLFRMGVDKKEIKRIANDIRMDLNPHPAGQIEHNVPEIDGIKLNGIQHKYRETVLFFPSQGQTCHAYCTFCYRWPQFAGLDDFKFAARETEFLVEYLKQNPQITDVLFTGGDPLIMKTKHLESYILPLLSKELSHLKTIRIGTKALTYWPYRFTSDKDAAELQKLFVKVNKSGKHLAFMAHFNHPKELETNAAQKAIQLILDTGAQIRTQSPIMRGINAEPGIWSTMWQKQVDLGCIPYYMFQARDTGAQHYFSVPLVESWEIFQEAYQNVSGVCRTVRGPSMSADPGKIHVLGVSEIKGEKVIALSFLQGRNPDWVKRPFFAEYNDKAIWLNELKPAFNEDQFFFEEDFEEIVGKLEHWDKEYFQVG